jgi:5-methyltetrahydrofolate--homocysteine methyltransferase
MVEYHQISTALMERDYLHLNRLIEAALAEGKKPEGILKEGLVKGMEEVGEKFKAGELFIPEVLAIAKGMQQSMDTLTPRLIQSGNKAAGKVVLGTVKGDLHDVGKNIVKMMFEGSGLKVYDLGIDLPAERFVEAVKTHDAQVLAMSALLTTTMGYMKGVIDSVAEAGLRDKIKIIIGGAPVTQSYADQIGADGYAPDAIMAVEKVKKWL